MSSPLRPIAFVALAMMLSACSNLTERQYESCIVGLTAVGGAIGAASSGGGMVAGAAVGAGTSLLICKEAVAPEPVLAAAVADSDGDGVDDDNDRCPGTPAGVEVDVRGCALDSDGDGVADYQDRCPNTPTGVSVDERGCPVQDEVILTVDRLNFAFDSAELNMQAKSALNEAVSVINAHSGVALNLVGYTDNSGPESYNQRLSERRAQAAVDYLVSQGVDSSQLQAKGMGEASPAFSNDSRDGRERNRRVELVVR